MTLQYMRRNRPATAPKTSTAVKRTSQDKVPAQSKLRIAKRFAMSPQGRRAFAASHIPQSRRLILRPRQQSIGFAIPGHRDHSRSVSFQSAKTPAGFDIPNTTRGIQTRRCQTRSTSGERNCSDFSSVTGKDVQTRSSQNVPDSRRPVERRSGNPPANRKIEAGFGDRVCVASERNYLRARGRIKNPRRSVIRRCQEEFTFLVECAICDRHDMRFLHALAMKLAVLKVLSVSDLPNGRLK